MTTTKYRVVKVKLDPTPSQTRTLEMFVGANRFAYNAALAHVKEQLDNGEKPDWTHFSLNYWWMRERDSIAPWWNECSKWVFDSAFENLGKSLSNFSKSKKGLRKGKRVGFPKFKKRGVARDTVAFLYQRHEKPIINKTHLRIPRLGSIHTLEPLPNIHPKIITVSRKAGYWFAAIMWEENVETPHVSPKNMVGIDLGGKHLATLSDGTIIPKSSAHMRKQRKIKRLQQNLSRTQKGSKRREVAKRKLAKAQLKATFEHHDYLRKITTWIANEYDSVALENLAVQNMMRKGGARKRGLNRNIKQSNLSMFREMLEYKMLDRGKTVAIIDRFYPSSKMCSSCGEVKAKLALNERVYKCEKCGYKNDRDVNAANNIAVAGSAPETLNGRGENVNPVISSGVRVVLDESSIKRGDFASSVRLEARPSNGALSLVSC